MFGLTLQTLALDFATTKSLAEGGDATHQFDFDTMYYTGDEVFKIRLSQLHYLKEHLAKGMLLHSTDLASYITMVEVLIKLIPMFYKAWREAQDVPSLDDKDS